ncbi:hypothetical protein [Aquabacterium sp.]|uniref:hypothetical protein n=1 Tax=Aquabacterium sp. TaxID=1872578 RepID=UPI002D14B41D|nr:hypothetical protein [Aquabacterium sp.]HSW04884.1 hypothetical protein [Aquabacterium sp.]
MSPSIAARLCIGTSLLAALSACYVVPIDHRTGQPFPVGQAPNVTIVQPSATPSAAPSPGLLQARLYPLNEPAQTAGLLMASVADQHSGRGSISLSYRGQLMQGDATRVDGGHPGFGRIHTQVLGNGNPSYGGRRGIANAYGNGVSAQCEYVITGPTIGTGACLFSDGAKYQMHFGQ